MFLLAWLAAGPVALAQDGGLYEGEVTVASQEAGVRAAALPAALAQVLAKVTGDPAAAQDPALQPALASAGELLRHYRYRQDVTGGGQPELRTTLVARFDQDGVDRLLAAGGRKAWPEPRPQPVVWLAIDDGRGPRLLGSAQASAVVALTAQAQRRGLKLTYPLLDLEDQRRIDAQRVWRGDTAAAMQAAARYHGTAVLLGRLYREDGAWIADWRVLHDGEQLARERHSDVESTRPLAAGADLAARALAARYHLDLAGAGAAGKYRVHVAGIGSAEDYVRLLGQLRRLPMVRAATPSAAVGDALELELDLSAGIAQFTRAAAALGLLASEAAPADRDLGAPIPRFRLLP